LNKEELIITALQQRIGEIVSNYETQIAVMRAEITQLIEKEAAKEEYSDSLKEQIKEV
jgi:phage host-nuclease inhibitor protein Gam